MPWRPQLPQCTIGGSVDGPSMQSKAIRAAMESWLNQPSVIGPILATGTAIQCTKHQLYTMSGRANDRQSVGWRCDSTYWSIWQWIQYCDVKHSMERQPPHNMSWGGQCRAIAPALDLVHQSGLLPELNGMHIRYWEQKPASVQDRQAWLLRQQLKSCRGLYRLASSVDKALKCLPRHMPGGCAT